MGRSDQPGGAIKGFTGTLVVDDQLVGEGRVDRTMGYRISLDETFDIGSDAGEPVSESYHVPFDLPGETEKVAVNLILLPGTTYQAGDSSGVFCQTGSRAHKQLSLM